MCQLVPTGGGGWRSCCHDRRPVSTPQTSAKSGRFAGVGRRGAAAAPASSGTTVHTYQTYVAAPSVGKRCAQCPPESLNPCVQSEYPTGTLAEPSWQPPPPRPLGVTDQWPGHGGWRWVCVEGNEALRQAVSEASALTRKQQQPLQDPQRATMSETHGQWCTVRDMMHKVGADPRDHRSRSAGLETGEACQRTSPPQPLSHRHTHCSHGAGGGATCQAGPLPWGHTDGGY